MCESSEGPRKPTENVLAWFREGYVLGLIDSRQFVLQANEAYRTLYE